MVEDFALVPGAGQEVVCPGCGSPYDGVTVAFCDCLDSTHSPVCPSCGKCVCKLPKADQQAFWKSAPAIIFRRRMDEKRSHDEPAGAQNLGALSRPLVLVAEDDPVTRRVAQRVLERMGYGVLVAINGEEALALALLHRPDVVLTDALMPKLDGRELCLHLKEMPDTAATKVVVMTGLFTKIQSKTETLNDFKADAFLKKPVDVEELKHVLEELSPLPKPPLPAGSHEAGA